ncbi:hypothetical protein ALC56_12444 [Trachymyrmex septentrionalis]|uniref:Uncharacterized protein n=1 Tax=Trachymyrmex septentrionalis TaxID=34720 RepID=A0A195EYD4_9HYME|nr:hypothetical protein ALC56_12444 [Trachymyrmex septentrionalis]
MAAGASGARCWDQMGGVGLAAPLFRYLLECMAAHAAPKPTLLFEAGECNDHLLDSVSSSHPLSSTRPRCFSSKRKVL